MSTDKDKPGKWIIYYDAGYGKTWDVVENATKEQAEEAAYDAWLQDAESNSDYGAEPYTPERAEEVGTE